MTASTSTEAGVDVDVLVIGAGPVGLTVACALAHHGVSTRIVDRREDPRRESRANNLWSRPQELLAGIGVRDRLADDAWEVRRAEVLVDGRPLDTLDFAGVASPYPTVLYSSQALIERRLREVLAERGVQVEGATTMQGLDQDDDEVHTTIVGGGGQAPAERVRSRYVVGADGADSSVRAALDIDMPIRHMHGRATRQIDASLAWRRSTEPDSLWFFAYHHGFAGVLPISGGRHRLFFVEDDAEVPDRDPTSAEMQDRAREVTGDPTVTLSDPVWSSHGRFSHGVASAHADRRVFLAGDAGHLNLPIGGQGMNAGLHDAVGLAWRLAMTLAGCGGDALLASYGVERNREHARLGRQQVTGFERLMYRNRVQDAVLDLAADLAPNLGSFLLGAEDLQQLTVSYQDSPLSEDHPPALLGRRAPRAGDRAPDARVTVRDGTTTSLFEQLYNPDGHSWGWCLLAFDGRDPRSHADLHDAIAEAVRYPWVHPRLVLAAPPDSEAGGAGGDGGRGAACRPLFDLDGDAHTAYGLEGHPGLVLVRPDGHVALRAPADRPERLRAYCDRVGWSWRSTSACGTGPVEPRHNPRAPASPENGDATSCWS